MVTGKGETRLRRKRKDAGMKQVELASRAGVSVGKVNQYERGWFVPTMPTARKLAAALSCDVSEIFDTDDLADS